MNEDDDKFYCNALKDAKQNQYTKEHMKKWRRQFYQVFCLKILKNYYKHNQNLSFIFNFSVRGVHDWYNKYVKNPWLCA